MRAFVIEEVGDDLHAEVVDYEPQPLDGSDVEIDVEFASVNFKDAMVAERPSRVRRSPRLVGGVDAAGTVRRGEGFRGGERVIVYGDGLGVSRDGGFAERLFAPARYVTRLPAAVSTRDAMAIGTAGVTAMASVLALLDHGVPAGGDVLVTGATGGVGSQSVAYLAAYGYRPVAATGTPDQAQWLRDLGAVDVIARDAVSDRPDRVLATELWDGAVDSVGGSVLHEILRALRYGGAVAASGLVAGAHLETSLYPFITRHVALLGIDVVEQPLATRERLWAALGDLDHDFSRFVDRTVDLEGVAGALEDLRANRLRGRVVVAL